MFRAAASSPYFARVSGSSAGDSGQYHVGVRAQDPQNERGSVPSSAVPLVPGAPPITARFDYVGDVDWYSFPATEGDLILVKMESRPVAVWRSHTGPTGREKPAQG